MAVRMRNQTVRKYWTAASTGWTLSPRGMAGAGNESFPRRQ